jgi:hypothetical protein
MTLERGSLRGFEHDRMVMLFSMMHHGREIPCAISSSAMDDLKRGVKAKPDQRDEQLTPLRYLPIAVEMIVAVVKAAAGLPIGNTEHAIHSADCAANTCPDCLANHAADWASHPVTFVSTLLRAAHDALRVPDLRNRQQSESERRARKIELRRLADRRGRRLDLVHNHLGSRCSARWPMGRASITPVQLKGSTLAMVGMPASDHNGHRAYSERRRPSLADTVAKVEICIGPHFW